MEPYVIVILLAVFSFAAQVALGLLLVNSNADNRIIGMARIVLAVTILVMAYGHVRVVYVVIPLIAGFVARNMGFLTRYNGYAGWANTGIIHLTSWAIIVICSLTMLTKLLMSLG
jgi:hypothetical protein